ncbi:uncharacterized protein [Nicotiana sylvestris]|uniref:uncharacterized protein n=1 Tax=Nicotiana sylvestris TaxID=4096 RepID=UPI00388CE190
MDEAKVRVIQEWEAPTKVIELRSFLGLVNYYHQFNSGYLANVAPLTELLKKNKPWVWMEHCQKAFEGLKAAIIEEPVLALPEFAKTFETQKKLTLKQAWLQDFLAEFDYALEYNPGKGNVVADALSRKVELAAITSARWDIWEAIKEGMQHDLVAKQLIELANKGKTRRFWIEDGLLLTTGRRVYVTKFGDIR